MKVLLFCSREESVKDMGEGKEREAEWVCEMNRNCGPIKHLAEMIPLHSPTPPSRQHGVSASWNEGERASFWKCLAYASQCIPCPASCHHGFKQQKDMPFVTMMASLSEYCLITGRLRTLSVVSSQQNKQCRRHSLLPINTLQENGQTVISEYTHIWYFS